MVAALEGLQRRLQEQEGDRDAFHASLSARLQSLEAAVAESKSSRRAVDVALAKLSQQASSHAAGAQLLLRPLVEDDDDVIAGLGVDWGAWTTGAAIDHEFTSHGAGRGLTPAGLAGRAARVLASAMPRWRTFIGMHVSHPPEVVLAADAAPPVRCFSIAGGGDIAVRLAGPRHLTHVVLEQAPAWATAQPLAAPRLFQVRASRAEEGAAAYDLHLGDFEYKLDGPRIQVFTLNATAGRLRGVLLAFGVNWGADATSICRVRLFGPGVPDQ